MNEYVVFDFETTGNKPYSAKIVQIGALLISNGSVIDTFESYVNPEMRIPEDVIKIHGITNDIVKDAPTIKEILPKFLSFIKNKTLVGYNIGSFDLNVLYSELPDDNFECDYVDVRYLDHKDNGTLESFCAKMSIVNQNAHNALSDCYATNEIFAKALSVGLDYDIKHFPSLEKRLQKKSEIKEKKALQIEQLRGILIGITFDNVLTEAEVYALKGWLENNSEMNKEYPYSLIMPAISKALDDGVLEKHELDELFILISKVIADEIETEEVSGITIEGMNFVLTGNFEVNTRDKLSAFMENKGGTIQSSIHTKRDRTNYLVIGGFGSLDWKYNNYGSKYEKAAKYNSTASDDTKIVILHEQDFLTLIGESALNELKSL